MSGSARCPRVVVGAVAVLAVLLVSALLATGCSGSDEPGAVAGTSLTSTPPTTPTAGRSTTTDPLGPTASPGSAPDPATDGVARVLFVGDSLTHGALGELKARFEAAGAEVRYVGAPGTGILSGGSWWVVELAEQLEAFPPDVVVFEDCCNYDGGEAGYALADGSVVHENTEEMFTAWEEVSAGAIARSRAAGAQVHWVVTPAIGDRPESEHERLDRYNAIVRGLDVDLIDWRAALTPDGSFQLELEVGGRPTPVRSRDQVHLVAAGNRVVTDVTWDAIADQLGLDGG